MKLPFATTWMGLEGIMLSEISQTEINKYCMISLVYANSFSKFWTIYIAINNMYDFSCSASSPALGITSLFCFALILDILVSMSSTSFWF